MSVSLNPSSALGFKRPLTQLVKRSLTITNNNKQPIAFKVKTTAPKLYCVRPNSGRVEPGESVDVSVMLQALREEPPLNAKCKDKFLIQSTLITPEKENLPLHDIWATQEKGEEAVVHQQKLRVTYLPAEGQTLEEEDETFVNPPPNQGSLLLPGDQGSRYDTVRQHPAPHSELNEPHRPLTPPADFNMARESSREEPTPQIPSVNVIHAAEPPQTASPLPPAAPQLEPEHEYLPEPAPEPRSVPEHIPAPVSVTESPDAELLAKYNAAQAEIERLRATIATMSAAPPVELRRRTRAISDADADSVAGSDVATTLIDDSHYNPNQEGVPLQVVVIIALAVFITTYLFF